MYILHILYFLFRDAKESIVESDQFKMDPVGFVSIMVANWSLPSHVVVFDLEERKIRDLLHSHFFIEVNCYIFMTISLVALKW